MAVCLEYQSVYRRKDTIVISVRAQLVVGVLLLGALVVKVWMKIESTDLGYQLSRERERAQTLEMEIREYELQRSVLLRRDNLSRVAAEKLGLVALDPERARRVVATKSE
jgi:hypothetical protein